MIHISKNKEIKKIFLENTKDNTKTIERLNKELSTSDKKLSYEITFINFKIIPASLLKNLHNIKNRLKITTTSKILWAYLSKLGLTNTYKDFIDSAHHKKKQRPKAIIIGGSNQSIRNIIPIIESIPYVNITIFITMHMSNDDEKYLCKVLNDLTEYNVYKAVHNMKIEQKSIYVATQNNNLITIDGYIYLENQRKINCTKLSIDVTFRSLVYEYKESLLGILLCGYNQNKSSFLEKLEDEKSSIVVESPLECLNNDLSISKLKINSYLRILTLPQIIYFLKSSMVSSIDIDESMDLFLEEIFKIYNYDFRYYERNSLIRRIELAMKQSHISDFKKYKIAVINDKKLFARLFRICSINMTSFFRNPEVFKDIRKKIIPNIENLSTIKVWCAGCSNGSEAYSIAILLDEAGLLSKSLIYATDFNEAVLNEAKNGLYTKSEFEEIELNYRNSGGKNELYRWINNKNGFIEIKEKIKEKIIFFRHNLATDNSINKFNLILCRNVLIYFNNELQEHVFSTIHDSLDKSSFLVLGESEVMPKNYKYKELNNKIFTKEIYDN